MRNNNLLAILLSVLLVSLSGCGEVPERNKWVVECDSGFTTGESYSTIIDDGIIRWTKEKNGQSRVRRMLNGEVCSDIMIPKEKKAN